MSGGIWASPQAEEKGPSVIRQAHDPEQRSKGGVTLVPRHCGVREYASFLETSQALHPDLFTQPGPSMLCTNRVFYRILK